MDAVVVGGPCSFEGCKRTTMYQSHYCYKHKGQKSKTKEQETETGPPLGEDLWWTDEDESRRCDDTPETAVCEFDTYDGICFHCKNMVHPDIHLIHLILNRRTAHGLLGHIFEILGEDLDPDLEEALDRILEPLAERDITAHPSLPPEARVKALQEMDDREHILTELEASFPDWKESHLLQFNLKPEGFGLGEEIHRLYDDIHAFNQEEWDYGHETSWAAEWKLKNPDPLPSQRERGTANLNPVAHLVAAVYAMACWNWLANADHYASSEDMEVICMIMTIPLFGIYQFFSYGHEME